MSPSGPRTAADMIIELPRGGVVLVRRKYSPPGWAIPGGLIEPGESAEQAAIREAREETGLAVELIELFHVYSDPHRDPRGQTIGIVFIGRADGDPVGADDAAEASTFEESALPSDIAFDHAQILGDYFRYKRSGERPPARLPSIGSLGGSAKSALLALARSAIRDALLGGAAPSTRALADGAPGSAFVTLYHHGQLRGCVGTLARDRGLEQVVQDMAVSAAVGDPRFPPLTLAELEQVDIEISVLSQPIDAAAENVIPGIHGISVSRGNCRGVFLPRIARDAGWDRETFLAETCRKAGLAEDAWKDPDTKLRVFWAESFGER